MPLKNPEREDFYKQKLRYLGTDEINFEKRLPCFLASNIGPYCSHFTKFFPLLGTDKNKPAPQTEY